MDYQTRKIEAIRKSLTQELSKAESEKNYKKANFYLKAIQHFNSRMHAGI